MRPLLKNTIKFFLFSGVSVLLFWLVYRDQDWNVLLNVFRQDVDYTWIGIACVLGVASHISRAMRWQLLTASMGYKIRFWNSFMGVMIGYFANLAIPRMGELINKFVVKLLFRLFPCIDRVFKAAVAAQIAALPLEADGGPPPSL